MFREIFEEIREEKKLAEERRMADIIKQREIRIAKTNEFFGEVKEDLVEKISDIFREAASKIFPPSSIEVHLNGVEYNAEENYVIRDGKYLTIHTKLAPIEFSFRKVAESIKALFDADGLRNSVDDSMFAVNIAHFHVRLPA